MLKKVAHCIQISLQTDRQTHRNAPIIVLKGNIFFETTGPDRGGGTTNLETLKETSKMPFKPLKVRDSVVVGGQIGYPW